MSAKRYDPLKRTIDVVVAGGVLFMASPVMLVVAVLVRLNLGSPVLFQQERPGLNGETFRLRKFRSMVDGDGDDAVRLTKFGAFLRSTSLDELPQLWNVVSGEMSLIGPRPLLVEYLPLYNDEQMRRHDVRPGITGLSQVTGRNTLSWPERFEIDVQYVDRRSLSLDLRILRRTVIKVIRRSDVSDASGPTMTNFMGNDSQPRRSHAEVAQRFLDV